MNNELDAREYGIICFAPATSKTIFVLASVVATCNLQYINKQQLQFSGTCLEFGPLI